MKKILSLLFPLALVLSGCTLEELENSTPDLQDGRIFTASFDQNETRTYIEEGNLLRWNAEDQISLFDGNTLNHQYKFDGETGDNRGTFSKVSSSFGDSHDLSRNYAVYPYNKDVKIDETGNITTTLPAEQSYAENSFGHGANTMVAATKDVDDTFLKFRNVGGYLKLQLYGDDVTIKSITLTGNNNEKLAGKATITSTYDGEPTVSMADDANTSITLDCGENGVKIGSNMENATEFWIVVPPTTFEGGFTITITDINDETFTKSTSNEIAIERNVIKPMKAGEVEIVAEGAIPNNQIWYTTKNQKTTNPWYTDVFGANIISNVYTDGKGVITFDGKVTSIGNYAFSFCDYLTSITIPNSVTTIGYNAFWECASLTNITIPIGVKKIESSTFSGCKSLTDITIPNTVTSIRSQAFYECTSLKSIILPENLTSIDKNAFQSCKSLTSIVIPNNVTSIGSSAFEGCTSMASVVIGNGVSTINEATFGGCTSLVNIDWGTKVTSIGNSAFNACNALHSLVIPDNITSIGELAFRKCRSLVNVTFGKNLETIGRHAFEDCDALSDILFEGPTTIGLGAFYGCDGLTYLEIPEQVVVGNTSFGQCNSLESVIVNGDLSSAYSAFYGCESLKEVKIYNNYRIDHFAFHSCSSLSSVTFDSNLKEIGQGAFLGTLLTTVILPENVSKIEYMAFKFIPIKKFYCYASTPPYLAAANNDGTTLSIFQDMDEDVILYVPKNTRSTYVNSRWGTYFTTIKEM